MNLATALPIIDESLSDRQKLVELVRKWGDVNTDGLLEDTTHIFSIPEIEGFIGYKLEASNRVVFGDPVSAEEDKPFLADAFQIDSKLNKLGVVYTIVTQDFAHWAEDNLSSVTIEFGKKYILNPQQNPMKNTGSKAVLVRKKVKQAFNEGVVVKEYLEENKDVEQAIEQVASLWLEKRKGPQIYLCRVSLFADRMGKRYFYAEKEGKVVGVLLLNELHSKKGWLLNNVMMVKNAPKGLSELLVISALQVLEKENCHYVLVGPVPAENLGEINGVGFIGRAVVKFIFKAAKRIFHLEGHETFWDKFQPVHESSYLIFPKKNIGFSSIRALMQAYNVGKGAS